MSSELLMILEMLRLLSNLCSVKIWRNLGDSNSKQNPLKQLKTMEDIFSHTFPPSLHLSDFINSKKHKRFGIYILEY